MKQVHKDLREIHDTVLNCLAFVLGRMRALLDTSEAWLGHQTQDLNFPERLHTHQSSRNRLRETRNLYSNPSAVGL